MGWWLYNVIINEKRRQIMDTKNLKNIRLDRGLTQVKVARDVGVTLNTYVKWEQGVMKPNEENAKKLKEVLGLK